MYTLGDVKMEMRGLAGDPDGEWMTDGYLLPIINHVLQLQINYLSNTASPFEEDVTEVLGIVAGTTDLTPYQQQGNDLFGLYDPYAWGIDWKMAGDSPTTYRQAMKTNRLPDIDPATPGFRTKVWWEWRAFGLYITPLSFDIDLRVRGDFSPARLKEDSDLVGVHPRIGPVLVEEAVAACWRERQNKGALQDYVLVATAALDDIANMLIRGEQATPIRVGRATSSRRGMRR